MGKVIAVGLSPNTEKDDVRLALRLLFQPWRWMVGPEVERLEESFKTYLPSKYAFAFASGRTAFYALLSSLDLQKDDEVLLQAYTCVAVPGPVLWVGAKPVWVDIEEKSFNLSLSDLKKKISSKSKVLVVQHTFGLPAQLDKILKIAKKHNLFVVEDCAHTLGSEFKGKKVGSFGDAAFFSFGRDKTISSVFGGLVTANNKNLAIRLKKFQSKAGYPPRLWVLQQLLHPIVFALVRPSYCFFGFGKIVLEAAKQLRVVSRAVQPIEKNGGQPGFAAKKMPNALAVLALHQLKKLKRFNKHREKIARFYQKELRQLDLKLPSKEVNSRPIFLRYPLRSPKAVLLIKKAKKKGIILGDWYQVPVAPRGTNNRKIFYQPGSCPLAEKVARQSFNLPTNINTSLKDALRIVMFLKENL